jgi:two-component system sensor histidine kinase KdpD
MITNMIESDDMPYVHSEREKLHTSLIYGVANDLRTPLASIIGSLEIYRRLRSKLSEERGDMLLATAVEEAKRLDSFVTNIMDMANFEKGRQTLKIQPSNPLQLIWGAIKRMESQLTQHDVQVHAPRGSATVYIDPMLFTRAFSILLENAAKYTPSQTPILVTLRTGDGQVQVEVRDCGNGIPEDQLESVFEKYTRLNMHDRQIAGTGLGLAICRAITKLHDGRIEAANHPMGGAVFTLTLPDQAPAEAAS